MILSVCLFITKMQLHFIWLTVVCIVSFTCAQTTDTSLSPEEMGTTMSNSGSCGKIMTSITDEIRYKKATVIAPNERCVWIVKAPSVDYYEVTVSLGEAAEQNVEMQNRLCILPIRRSNETSYQCLDGKQNGDNHFQRFTLECNMLLVVFFSKSDVSNTDRGFSLSYTGFKNDRASGPKTFTANLLTSGMPLKHPLMGNYTSNELAIFVSPLQNNIFIRGYTRSIMYRKMANGLYGDKDTSNCNDYLNWYKFTIDSALMVGKWMYGSTLCPSASDTNIVHDDLVMFIFQSDSTGEGPGFTLACSRT